MRALSGSTASRLTPELAELRVAIESDIPAQDDGIENVTVP